MTHDIYDQIADAHKDDVCTDCGADIAWIPLYCCRSAAHAAQTLCGCGGDPVNEPLCGECEEKENLT